MTAVPVCLALRVVTGRDERDDGDIVIAAVIVRDGERRTSSAEAAGFRQNSQAAEKCQAAVNAHSDGRFLRFFYGSFTSFPQSGKQNSVQAFRLHAASNH